MIARKIALLFVLTCVVSVFAQTTVFGHSGKVNDCFYNKPTASFFSAGNDGFICEWKNGTKIDSYQISALPILKVITRPESPLLAVYESDGFTTHKVSVWDWTQKKRLYTKRFSDSVLSLGFSAKGTWLIVSTLSMDGLVFFSASNGQPLDLLDSAPSNVVLAQTSPSEAILVTYANDGYITFFDMKKGTERAQFLTEGGLIHPQLHRHNALLTGITNTKTVITINMKNGEVVNSYSEKNSDVMSLFVHAATSDAEPLILERFPTKFNYRTYTEVLAETKESHEIPDFSRLTAVAYDGSSYFCGTESGEIVTITKSPTDVPQVVLEEPTELTQTDSTTPPEQLAVTIAAVNTRKPIHDVTFTSTNGVFALTDGALYRQLSPTELPVKVRDIGTEYNHVASNNDILVFWSDRVAAPVLTLNTMTPDEALKTLYEATSSVSSLSFSNTFSVIIENYCKVSVIDTVLAKVIFSYSGAGLQNGIYNQNEGILFVAKTAASEPRSILLRIDTKTGETVPSTIAGSVLYGLSPNATVTKAYGYIILESIATGQMTTELTEIDLKKLSSKRIAKYEAENVDSFLTYSNGRVYTDLSVNSISEITVSNTSQIRQNLIKRISAMPRNIKVSESYLLILNKDGTYSWYDKKKLTPLSTVLYSGGELWSVE